MSNQNRLPVAVGTLFVAIYLLTGGGRIASSDGNTMFALSRSLATGRLAITEGLNGQTGRGGHFYAKADPGQALVALPWVAAGTQTARWAPAPMAGVWAKGVASSFNAAVAGALVASFLVLVRTLGYSTSTSVWLALALGLATPLWAYSKSFLREPLLGLCLVHALTAAHRGRDGRAGAWLALGMITKSAMVLQLPCLLAFRFWQRRLEPQAPAVRWLGLVALPLAAVVGLLAYNAWRFGSIFQTGYDPSVDTFSTPLWVGLYGQLFSSGKSIFLYAPIALAALWGLSGLWRHHGAMARATVVILVINLILHAKFASWAGEGSWGPRYLVPFLPLFVLPAAELLQGTRRRARALARVAIALGVVVQLGGVSVYFGSYMRDIGEFPYQRNFTDPLFMARSHFVPNYSPVVGHWRLLVQNAALLAGPNRPVLEPVATTDRLPVTDAGQRQLPYVLDYWWCYALYTGAPAPAVGAALAVGVAVCVALGVWVRRLVRRGWDPDPKPCLRPLAP